MGNRPHQSIEFGRTQRPRPQRRHPSNRSWPLCTQQSASGRPTTPRSVMPNGSASPNLPDSPTSHPPASPDHHRRRTHLAPSLGPEGVSR